MRWFVLMVVVVAACEPDVPIETEVPDLPVPPDAMRPDPPAPPIPPAAPAPVVPPDSPRLQCPDRWSLVDTDVAPYCEPWSKGLQSCAKDEAHFPGDAGCRRVGTPCAPSGWPEIPTDAVAIYVRAGATNGDGSEARPYGSIANAVVTAPSGSIVALAVGHYAESVRISDGLTLLGACTASTTIDGGAVAAIVGAGTSEVKNLRVVGGDTGVVVRGSGTTMTIVDSILGDTAFAGVIASEGATLTLRDSVIRSVRPRAGEASAAGVFALSGGRVELYGVVVDDISEIALGATTRGAIVAADFAVVEPVPTIDGGGFGVYAAGGAVVELYDGTIERAGLLAIAAYGAGTRLIVDGVLVRETLSDATRTQGHGFELIDGANASITNSAIVGTRNVGVRAAGARTSVRMTDTVVRDTESEIRSLDGGAALFAFSGATAELERVVLFNNAFAGVSVDSGGTLDLVDVHIETTRGRRRDGSAGQGILAGPDTTVTGDRVAVIDAQKVGVVLSGSTATFDDLSIRGTRPERISNALGHGLWVVSQSSLTARRVHIEDNLNLSLGVLEGTASIDDLVVRTTRYNSDPEFDTAAGIKVFDDASLSVRRAIVSANDLAGVIADGTNTALELVDVTIVDTRPGADGAFGYGLQLARGAQLRFERLDVDDNTGTGFAAFHESTVASGTDLVVRDTKPNPVLEDRGWGLQVVRGAKVSAERVAVSDNRDIGVVALDGATIELVDATVSRTKETGCPEQMCNGGGNGIGAFTGATIAVERFEISGHVLAGIQIARDGAVDLVNGFVRDCTVGANVSVPGFDVDRLSNNVRFERNGQNLDGKATPAPTPIEDPLSNDIGGT